MELLHGLSAELGMSRKAARLRNCQREVQVLTNARHFEAWTPALKEALRDCARRGLRVRVLLETGVPSGSAAAAELRRLGLEARQAPKRFSWVLRPFPVLAEVWVFDQAEAITANERLFRGPASGEAPALRVEYRLDLETSRGIGSYLERRWESEGRTVVYSVRHQLLAFHGGPRAELEFYDCVRKAKGEIRLCVPGGRVSRRVESALHEALRERIPVTLYTNADRDDGPGLRRLRRLSGAGAVVKICGRRLRSELAVLDGRAVYFGSLPTSWHRWTRVSCPIFVVQDDQGARTLLEALEAQVSVEIPGALLQSSPA